MAHTRGDVWRALAVGAALAVLTAIACLAFAAQREADTITLGDLLRDESLAMSCDETASTAEPLWCVDPSSPRCMPAAPDTHHLDLGDRVDVWISSPLAAAWTPTQRYTVRTWPAPIVACLHGRSACERLERPPRV